MNELDPFSNQLKKSDDVQPAGGAQRPGADMRIGRYRVLAVLGKGGMGSVYKAHDPDTDTTVAIKVIDNEAAADPESLKRFEREARSAMVLDHPRVAQIYSQEKDQNGRPFIVMEYVEGMPLDRFIKENPDAPFSVLVEFVLQVAHGLDAAHRRSIIHRDIKPSNIIVQPNNHIKIIDFGLAKSLWDQTAITATDMVVGTPRYLSPEQGMGRGVDHRADIYSLGATFYELVTRQSPYDGDTPLAIMMKHINSPLTPPYMINPKVPGDINEIICRMMAKDPGQRYADYDTLISDLEQAKLHRMAKEQRLTDKELAILGETPPGGLSAGKGGPRSYLTEGLVNVSVADMPQEPPTSKLKVIALAIVGVLIIITAVATVMQPEDPTAPKEPSMVAQGVKRLLGRMEPPPETKPEDVARDDAGRISATRSQMELVVGKVIEQGRGGSTPTMTDLIGAGVLTEEETTDAWGNPLILTSSRGGLLKSSGRDGVEGNNDDIEYTLDGTPAQIPRALTAEDVATGR